MSNTQSKRRGPSRRRIGTVLTVGLALIVVSTVVVRGRSLRGSAACDKQIPRFGSIAVVRRAGLDLRKDRDSPNSATERAPHSTHRVES
jgi:hypothetical protein